MVERHEAPERSVITALRAGRHVDDLIVSGEKAEHDWAHRAAVAACQGDHHGTPPRTHEVKYSADVSG